MSAVLIAAARVNAAEMRKHYNGQAKARADLFDEMADKLQSARSLMRALLENDPDDMAADGVTCLDVWRKEAEGWLK